MLKGGRSKQPSNPNLRFQFYKGILEGRSRNREVTGENVKFLTSPVVFKAEYNQFVDLSLDWRNATYRKRLKTEMIRDPRLFCFSGDFFEFLTSKGASKTTVEVNRSWKTNDDPFASYPEFKEELLDITSDVGYSLEVICSRPPLTVTYFPLLDIMGEPRPGQDRRPFMKVVIIEEQPLGSGNTCPFHAFNNLLGEPVNMPSTLYSVKRRIKEVLLHQNNREDLIPSIALEKGAARKVLGRIEEKIESGEIGGSGTITYDAKRFIQPGSNTKMIIAQLFHGMDFMLLAINKNNYKLLDHPLISNLLKFVGGFVLLDGKKLQGNNGESNGHFISVLYQHGGVYDSESLKKELGGPVNEDLLKQMYSDCWITINSIKRVKGQRDYYTHHRYMSHYSDTPRFSKKISDIIEEMAGEQSSPMEYVLRDDAVVYLSFPLVPTMDLFHGRANPPGIAHCMNFLTRVVSRSMTVKTPKVFFPEKLIYLVENSVEFETDGLIPPELHARKELTDDVSLRNMLLREIKTLDGFLRDVEDYLSYHVNHRGANVYRKRRLVSARRESNMEILKTYFEGGMGKEFFEKGINAINLFRSRSKKRIDLIDRIAGVYLESNAFSKKDLGYVLNCLKVTSGIASNNTEGDVILDQATLLGFHSKHIKDDLLKSAKNVAFVHYQPPESANDEDAKALYDMIFLVDFYTGKKAFNASLFYSVFSDVFYMELSEDDSLPTVFSSFSEGLVKADKPLYDEMISQRKGSPLLNCLEVFREMRTDVWNHLSKFCAYRVLFCTDVTEYGCVRTIFFLCNIWDIPLVKGTPTKIEDIVSRIENTLRLSRDIRSLLSFYCESTSADDVETLFHAKGRVTNASQSYLEKGRTERSFFTSIDGSLTFVGVDDSIDKQIVPSLNSMDHEQFKLFKHFSAKVLKTLACFIDLMAMSESEGKKRKVVATYDDETTTRLGLGVGLTIEDYRNNSVCIKDLVRKTRDLGSDKQMDEFSRRKGASEFLGKLLFVEGVGNIPLGIIFSDPVTRPYLYREIQPNLTGVGRVEDSLWRRIQNNSLQNGSNLIFNPINIREKTKLT